MLHKRGSAIKLINCGCLRPSGDSISYLINLKTKSLFVPARMEWILPDNDRKSFYLILIEDFDEVSKDLLL